MPKELTAKPGRQVVMNIAVKIIPLINNNSLLSIYDGLGLSSVSVDFILILTTA